MPKLSSNIKARTTPTFQLNKTRPLSQATAIKILQEAGIITKGLKLTKHYRASQVWRHYEYQPSFVLGFHGCDIDTANNLISGKTTHLKHSENNYDWLGHGIYFWEGDPTRTHEWALASHKKPAVLGAIIDLRHCLDLFNRQALEETRRSHEALIKALTGPKLFKTANIPANNNKRRNLDCAVFQFLHAARKNNAYFRPA